MGNDVMKCKLIDLLAGLYEHLKPVFIIIAAMLPTILVLDLCMGIQINRDFGLPVVIGFGAAQVFYAEVYARYIYSS